MTTTSMGRAKKAALITTIAALALGLSGCYNVAGRVALSGTSVEEAQARVSFSASILEKRLSEAVPVTRLETGELDVSRRLQFLRDYFDPFFECCGNPPSTLTNYITVGAEPGARGVPNGRMAVWNGVPVTDGATFRTESFGGVNVSTFDQYVLVRASMTLPSDRTGEATGGQFEVVYPDNWRLVESNGEPGYDDYLDDETVFWTGQPGERVDIAATFEVYKDASEVPRLQIMPLVDANGNEVVAEPTPQPEALADLSVLTDVAVTNDPSAEGEWIINSDGEFELVGSEVTVASGGQGSFVVGIAWGLLASGVLSGLVVLFVMAMRGRKLMAGANDAK